MNRSRVTRRSFLQAGVAAVAAPYLVSASALGKGDKPAASQRVALAHIGVGNQGRSLMRSFSRCKGFQTVAISDAYKNRREGCAAMCKCKAYGDFRDVLARKDVDAIVIATPDHWHVAMAMAAARAKKDVYLEKPLGLTIGQDLACRKAFVEHQRIFQYGTMQRSSDHCHRACQLVRSVRIGKVHRIEVVAPNGKSGGSTTEVPVPAGFDYDTWLGPAPKAPYTSDRCNPPGTYMIYDYSIGYLAGWGAHPLDLAVWGSDCDLAGPYAVEGTGEIPTAGLYSSVINWNMKLHMAGGVEMTFLPGGDSTKFIGSEGWVRVWRGGIDAHPKSLLTAAFGPNDAKLLHSKNHYQNFIDAVKTRGATVSPISDAVRSDVISHLCNIAVRTGRKITWDPKAETIVGDAEAAKMLERPMRAPWTL